MNTRELLKELHFSSKWEELGVVDLELLQEFAQEYGTGEDRNPEHFRWRAFTRFLDKNESLEPEVFWALYNLGENDPDYTMGGSMMRRLLDRKDCPVSLIEKAAGSDRDFLVQAAVRALKRRLASR